MYEKICQILKYLVFYNCDDCKECIKWNLENVTVFLYFYNTRMYVYVNKVRTNNKNNKIHLKIVHLGSKHVVG
jgi:hypothetical protein